MHAIAKKAIALSNSPVERLNVGDIFPIVDRHPETNLGPHLILKLKTGEHLALPESLFEIVNHDEDVEAVRTEVLKSVQSDPQTEEHIDFYPYPCNTCGALWEPGHYIDRKGKTNGARTCFVCRKKRNQQKKQDQIPAFQVLPDEPIARAIQSVTPHGTDQKHRTTLAIGEDTHALLTYVSDLLAVPMNSIVEAALQSKFEEISEMIPNLTHLIAIRNQAQRIKSKK